MTDLETALVELGHHLDYPPAPNLVAEVRDRVRRGDSGEPRRRFVFVRPEPQRVLAVCAVVAVVLASLSLWAPARRAIADFFSLPGVLFSDDPAPVMPGVPGPGEGLRLGEPVTMNKARSEVDFPVESPFEVLGQPDAVYVDSGSSTPVVSLVYRPDPPDLPEAKTTGVGLLLSLFRGSLDEPVVSKFVGPDGPMERVSVSGHRGFWLEGPPHVVLYLDAEGEIREDSVRLAANVLLWDNDGVIHRLESALDRQSALALAESVR